MYCVQVTAQEISDIRNFIDLLNMESKSAVIVEGKRDSFALRQLGFTGVVLEFHHFNGLIRFADHAARYEKLIFLFDGDRKGKYLTARLIENLQRRTKVDLTFKKKLVSITKGKIRFIEQMIFYESYLA